MKNYSIAFFMLCAVMVSQAQNDSIKSANFAQNEVKLNAIFLLLGAFEASYERNISEKSSVGVSALIPFDRDDLDTDLNYYVSPYYRMFFGKKYAAGFFLEGFGMLNSTSDLYLYQLNGTYFYKEQSITDFALGFGLGGKWFTKGGFVFEVNGGLGRNLLNGKSDAGVTLVGKFGFNVGYRF